MVWNIHLQNHHNSDANRFKRLNTILNSLETTVNGKTVFQSWDFNYPSENNSIASDKYEVSELRASLIEGNDAHGSLNWLNRLHWALSMYKKHQEVFTECLLHLEIKQFHHSAHVLATALCVLMNSCCSSVLLMTDFTEIIRESNPLTYEIHCPLFSNDRVYYSDSIAFTVIYGGHAFGRRDNDRTTLSPLKIDSYSAYRCYKNMVHAYNYTSDKIIEHILDDGFIEILPNYCGLMNWSGVYIYYEPLYVPINQRMNLPPACIFSNASGFINFTNSLAKRNDAPVPIPQITPITDEELFSKVTFGLDYLFILSSRMSLFLRKWIRRWNLAELPLGRSDIKRVLWKGDNDATSLPCSVELTFYQHYLFSVTGMLIMRAPVELIPSFVLSPVMLSLPFPLGSMNKVIDVISHFSQTCKCPDNTENGAISLPLYLIRRMPYVAMDLGEGAHWAYTSIDIDRKLGRYYSTLTGFSRSSSISSCNDGLSKNCSTANTLQGIGDKALSTILYALANRHAGDLLIGDDFRKFVKHLGLKMRELCRLILLCQEPTMHLSPDSGKYASKILFLKAVKRALRLQVHRSRLESGGFRKRYIFDLKQAASGKMAAVHQSKISIEFMVVNQYINLTDVLCSNINSEMKKFLIGLFTRHKNLQWFRDNIFPHYCCILLTSTESAMHYSSVTASDIKLYCSALSELIMHDHVRVSLKTYLGLNMKDDICYGEYKELWEGSDKHLLDRISRALNYISRFVNRYLAYGSVDDVGVYKEDLENDDNFQSNPFEDKERTGSGVEGIVSNNWETSDAKSRKSTRFFSVDLISAFNENEIFSVASSNFDAPSISRRLNLFTPLALPHYYVVSSQGSTKIMTACNVARSAWICDRWLQKTTGQLKSQKSVEHLHREPISCSALSYFVYLNPSYVNGNLYRLRATMIRLAGGQGYPSLLPVEPDPPHDKLNHCYPRCFPDETSTCKKTFETIRILEDGMVVSAFAYQEKSHRRNDAFNLARIMMEYAYVCLSHGLFTGTHLITKALTTPNNSIISCNSHIYLHGSKLLLFEMATSCPTISVEIALNLYLYLVRLEIPSGEFETSKVRMNDALNEAQLALTSIEKARNSKSKNLNPYSGRCARYGKFFSEEPSSKPGVINRGNDRGSLSLLPSLLTLDTMIENVVPTEQESLKVSIKSLKALKQQAILPGIMLYSGMQQLSPILNIGLIMKIVYGLADRNLLLRTHGSGLLYISMASKLISNTILLLRGCLADLHHSNDSLLYAYYIRIWLAKLIHLFSSSPTPNSDLVGRLQDFLLCARHSETISDDVFGRNLYSYCFYKFYYTTYREQTSEIISNIHDDTAVHCPWLEKLTSKLQARHRITFCESLPEMAWAALNLIESSDSPLSLECLEAYFLCGRILLHSAKQIPGIHGRQLDPEIEMMWSDTYVPVNNVSLYVLHKFVHDWWYNDRRGAIITHAITSCYNVALCRYIARLRNTYTHDLMVINSDDQKFRPVNGDIDNIPLIKLPRMESTQYLEERILSITWAILEAESLNLGEQMERTLVGYWNTFTQKQTSIAQVKMYIENREVGARGDGTKSFIMKNTMVSFVNDDYANLREYLSEPISAERRHEIASCCLKWVNYQTTINDDTTKEESLGERSVLVAPVAEIDIENPPLLRNLILPKDRNPSSWFARLLLHCGSQAHSVDPVWPSGGPLFAALDIIKTSHKGKLFNVKWLVLYASSIQDLKVLSETHTAFERKIRPTSNALSQDKVNSPNKNAPNNKENNSEKIIDLISFPYVDRSSS